mmetsp:Transcript_7396/g.31371  ORF Transcript_7396/g.31371 Transcript_7396/m.31371 type:complete len:280 (-) Transcript_7396:400-1239(-)
MQGVEQCRVDGRLHWAPACARQWKTRRRFVHKGRAEHGRRRWPFRAAVWPGLHGHWGASARETWREHVRGEVQAASIGHRHPGSPPVHLCVSPHAVHLGAMLRQDVARALPLGADRAVLVLCGLHLLDGLLVDENPGSHLVLAVGRKKVLLDDAASLLQVADVLRCLQAGHECVELCTVERRVARVLQGATARHHALDHCFRAVHVFLLLLLLLFEEVLLSMRANLCGRACLYKISNCFHVLRVEELQCPQEPLVLLLAPVSALLSLGLFLSRFHLVPH